MAAPTVNNVQSFATTDTASPVTLSSYVVSSGGSGKVLVVCITTEETSEVSVTGVTFGSDTLAAAVQQANPASGTPLNRAEIWFVENPTVQTADIDVAFSSVGVGRWTIVAFYLTDAATTGQPDDTGTDITYSSGLDATLTTTVNECLLVGVFDHGDLTPNWTVGSGFTAHYQDTGVSHTSLVESKDAGTAGAKSVDATGGGTSRPVGVSVAFRPVAAAAATPKNPFGLALSGPLERVVL